MFVKGGKALDYFSAGTYTLNANNIPVLQSLVNLPFGKRTPFTAEVFFINRTTKLDVFWGTSDPISLIDPKYNVRLRVRAFGQFGVRITDFRVFLTELIGALGDNNVVQYDTIVNYFRGITVTKIKTLISNTIINNKISVLEIAPMLEQLSSTAENSISFEFERFGITIVNFLINSVNFPDEDFETINRILGEKAAFEIIGDSRYNVKRSFDVMETAAGNESEGSLAAAGLGLGLGTGAGLVAGNAFTQYARDVMPPPSAAKSVPCRKCSAINDTGDKFCGSCGSSIAPEQVPCHSCQSMVDKEAKFCSECGNSMQAKACPACSKHNAAGTKFCSDCGTKLEGNS